jgi:hypothetical protein
MTFRRSSPHARARWSVLMGIVAVLTLLVGTIALASHPEASLAGSNFEIDVNANLKRDDAAPSIDWASVTEIRRGDAPTGRDDNSYAGGAKEDDACPGVTTGSIPNNKSDLLTFGVYTEPGATAGDPGYLHFFWTRVQEPSGTTLMDFEFNQSSTDCGNGVNPVRTEGDLLVEYRIEQGGAVANIKVREWTGTAWGTAQDLTAIGAATGTINSTAIPAAEADGLGALSARTFGEASLDLDFIFDEESCESFGSAFLKSRSSDSFTSQMKDYIAPVPLNLTNCGTVIIRKQTDPDEAGNTTEFDYTKSFPTDPTSANTFDLTDDESITFSNVLFGTGYTVTEDALPTGWDFASLVCSASQNVTPSITGDTVTFAIDSSADVLDCTYTNRARGTIIVEKITDDGAGAFSYTSTTLSPTSFTLTTTGPGAAGKASRTFSDLAPNTYNVAETVPAGWNQVSATCSDGSPVTAIVLSGGETVTCTFHNARERGAIEILKTRKHAATGSGDYAHAGVTFTISGGGLTTPIVVQTDANGRACVGNLLFSNVAGVGNYTVTETVPAGYHVTSTNPQTVTVDNEAACTATPYVGESVSFANMPLTDINVTVNSQVDGGTASTITCDWQDPDETTSTGANGDGSLGELNLEPGTYTCVIVVDP